MTRVGLPVLALLCALSLACGGDDDDGSPFEGTQPPTATATLAPATTTSETTSSATTTTATPSSTELAVDAPSSGFADVQPQRVFGNVTLEGMTGLYQAPNGDWYVMEQVGRLSRFANAPDAQAELIADLTDRVNSRGQEEGLLGFAFSPEFAEDNAFYMYYSAANPRRTVLSRFNASSPDVPATEQVLLEVDQPYSNHNGGQIVFGPDGYLYVGLGDGGSGNDPHGNGQNIGTLLGDILRIDVSGGGAEYTVPSDNPHTADPNARGEIWASGLRNPWRLSFDTATGDLWAGDVGQNSREEIDIIVRGGNYGWNVMEGAECRGGGSGCDSSGLLPPVFDYETGDDGTCSVTGGYVYRGEAIPALRGAYVFSDYCNGVLYALRAAGGTLTEQTEIGDTGFQVSTFAQDNAGELYVLEHADEGGIYRLVP